MGVSTSNLLTVKEVEVLMRRYEVEARGKDDDADVNYGKLCEQIEKVSTNDGGWLVPSAHGRCVPCTTFRGAKREVGGRGGNAGEIQYFPNPSYTESGKEI